MSEFQKKNDITFLKNIFGCLNIRKLKKKIYTKTELRNFKKLKSLDAEIDV